MFGTWLKVQMTMLCFNSILQIEWQKIDSTLNLMAFNFSLLLLFFHLFFVLVDWISKRNGKLLDYKVQNGFYFFNMAMVKLNVWHICGENCVWSASVLIFDVLGDALQRHHLQALSLPLVNDSFINSFIHSFIHCFFCRVNPPNILSCYILFIYFFNFILFLNFT